MYICSSYHTTATHDMRKSILLIITIILGLSAYAQQQNYDFSYPATSGQTLYFRILDSRTRTAAVVAQRLRAPQYDKTPTGKLNIPGTVIYEGNNYTVSEIGERAFTGCSDLTEVILPNSIEVIGAYAFSGCTSLLHANLPINLTKINSSAFAYCSVLTGQLSIPDKVSSIGSFAFAGCSSITGLSLSSALTTIGSSAFKGCVNMRGTITISPKMSSIGAGAFAECIRLSAIVYNGSDYIIMGSSATSAFLGCTGITSLTIGNDVHIIPDHAFRGLVGLTSISIPNRVTTIGHAAFYGCSGLTGQLVIPNSVTRIGGSAFYGCTGLTSVKLSDKLAEIPNFAFYQCTGLKGKLNIPERVTSIGNSAFKGCFGITESLDLPAGLVTIGNDAFMGCTGITGTLTLPVGTRYIGGGAFSGCKRVTAVEYGAEDCRSMGSTAHPVFEGCIGIRSLTIFNGVKQIPANAFDQCSSITGTIKIPEGTTAIGSNAFSDCTGINEVIFPEEMVNIGSGAFRNCASIRGELVIPKNVSQIGNFAFEGCKSLSAIQMDGFAPSVGPNSFRGIRTQLPVYVPCQAFLSYQNSENWHYFSKIEGSNSANTIKVASTSDTMGVVTILQKNSCSFPQAIIEAKANEGYQFLGWTDGNKDNPRTVTVSSDTLFTAQFDSTYQVAITAVANDEKLGTVLGGGQYDHGASTTLVAAPAFGHAFMGWSDGSTENPRNIEVNGKAHYVALFYYCDGNSPAKQEEPVVEKQDDTYSVMTDSDNIVVNGAKGHTIRIYDDYGRCLETKRKASETFRFKVPGPGNYLVQVDSGRTRRVVIASR